ncbi:MAG: transporter substrate-binding domain-containing protein [Defluviitaleaceae bacterium]|nr:transporter substrate-binding domain-containing protein [Defluviitaleaceae bacterium]
MKMRRNAYIAYALFFCLIFAITSAGCTRDTVTQNGSRITESPFATFRDIPGVTDDEIAAIEALQRDRDYFVYGMILSTEAFIKENGEIGGYAALFCEWLEQLFGIPFVPRLFTNQELFEKILTGEVDFSGNMMFTPQRAEIYNMTVNIAERQLLTIKLPGTDLTQITQERLPRYAFITGTPMEGLVAAAIGRESYEAVWVQNYSDAHLAIQNDEADAFIAANIAHAYFTGYDVVINDFFPLIFSSVTMAAAKTNPELEPIISVVTRAQQNGGLPFMTHLYNRGYEAFKRNAIATQMTDGERAFIAANPVVPIALYNTNYPLSFWNTREGEWQGIFVDVLDNVTALTGLTFEVIHDENASITDIHRMLESGEALLIPTLARTNENESRFIWSEHVLLHDNFAFVSKSDFRPVTVNEILHVRVGLARDMEYTDLFRRWFPNHQDTVEFDFIDDALEALKNGEVDMVASSKFRVLQLTHFQELPQFKPNVVFNHPLTSSIAFGGGQTELKSIVDSALRMIDIDGIALQWTQRTYDFRARMLEAQRPLLIGVIVSVLTILTLLLLFVIRSRVMAKRISQQKNSLEEAVIKLDLAMKAGKIGMWDMEIQRDDPLAPDNHVHWPDTFRHMIGLKDETDFPNKVSSIVNHLHPDDVNTVLSTFNSHLNDKTGKTPYDVEYRMRKKDGGITYIHATGETIRDEQGNPLRVAGTIINITERRKMLSELENAVWEAQEATKAKNNTVSILENILDNIDGQIYTTDPETNVLLFVNENLKALFGIEGDEALGRYCYEVFRGLDKKCANCPCYKLDKNPDQTIVWEEYIPEMGLHIRHSDRYIDWVDGSTVHLQLAVDITELVKAKEQEGNLRKEAETANKAKSEFLSHISHEIRTPMNAVLGTAEIHLLKGSNSPEIEEAFNTIYGSGSLLLNIINDILDLSKIEAGKLEIIPRQYDIPSLIYDTMQLNLLRYDSKPIDFDLKINERTPLDMFGDELRIKQVLNNIISNAFKYTDTGRIELSVSAEIEGRSFNRAPGTRTPCTLILQVSDTGHGMDEEQVEQLFEEYTRFNLDANRTVVGTGLGMHITKRLVDAMRGEIIVKSESGVGSVFIVKIPQMFIGTAVCGADMADHLCSSRFKTTFKPRQSQIIYEHMPYGSVLVVDDVESNLYVAKGMMLPYGLKIETVTSGVEAIDKVKNGGTYDIIFMDHMMPRMNGMEATKILREMGYANPIVALTANAVMGSSDMFLSNGFDGYISKPIDIRELNNSLNRLIRDKKPPEVVEAARREMGDDKNTAAFDPRQVAVSSDKIMLASLRDIENATGVLKDILSSLGANGEADIELYTTTVHGMKSALSNINEHELSEMAYRLERIGQSGEKGSILSDTPPFVAAIEALADKIRPDEAAVSEDITESDSALLREKLSEIKTACENIKKKSAKTALDELLDKVWSREIKDLLDDISDNLLSGRFKKAVASIEAYINR